MQAVLHCDLNGVSGQPWPVGWLDRKVSGVRLLKRHLLALRQAGIQDVLVVVREEDRARVEAILPRCAVADLEARLAGPAEVSRERGFRLEQRADTVYDPRLVSQCVTLAQGNPGAGQNGFACYDKHQDNYETAEKSPYTVGVPDIDEAVLAECTDAESREWYPVGLEIRAAHGGSEPCRLLIGRYYWHRILKAEDFRVATWKVLLATMKRTDGIYARTNRRVSLRISKGLIDTPVTPNVVTLFTLVCSLCAGLLFAQGTYLSVAAGGFVSWAASMLDGVDGELARSRFQASDFGCWLEMVCDYLYYVFVFSGLGIGLYRASGDPLWFIMGLLSVGGVLLSFAVIARQRRRFARKAAASDFGLAWQKTVESHSANPVYGFARKLGFLATRAALPYYIAFFCFLGLSELLLVLIALGTNLAWSVTLYTNRIFTQGA